MPCPRCHTEHTMHTCPVCGHNPEGLRYGFLPVQVSWYQPASPKPQSRINLAFPSRTHPPA